MSEETLQSPEMAAEAAAAAFAAIEENNSAGAAATNYRRVAAEEESEGLLWLVTFTDIMALLLTFFVLLYSMSVPKEKEWKELSTGISSEFQKYHSAEWYKGEEASISLDKLDFSEALDLNYLRSVIAETISQNKSLSGIVLIPQQSSLIVSLPQELLFASGQTNVSAEGRKALFSLGSSLSRIKNRIEVIGHADPRPVENAQSAYSDNWQLSLARAGSVAQILNNAGYSRDIILRGLSSGRYADLPEDMSEEEKLSLSRRVDIVLMRDDGRTPSMLDLE